jgi:hypothetical protein
LAKKLKKKIEEMCGLIGLDWESRQTRANQILDSSEWKQRLCNELVGLSFRELEQTLTSVATERQKKEDSYEKKLKAYNGKANGSRNGSRQKPLRGDSTQPTSTPTAKSTRTLQQILAQVYAPRESEPVFSWPTENTEMAGHQQVRQTESHDLLPEPDDDNGGS